MQFVVSWRQFLTSGKISNRKPYVRLIDGDLALRAFLEKLQKADKTYDIQVGKTDMQEMKPRDLLPVKIWIIDLQSFDVEARTAEEAVEEAQRLLASGEWVAEIENVVEDVLANDD